jgi:hypothetical protein
MGTVQCSAMLALACSVVTGRPFGVADDVGHAAVHHGPGSFGEVGRDDAEGAEVVFAALDHLHVVDAGELGVLPAGGVGGADHGGAQQRRPGFGYGLSLAVGVAGLDALGVSPVKDRNWLPRRNRVGSPMAATRAGPPTSARPGRERARPVGSTQR